MATLVISTLKQKGTASFPIVEAEDVGIDENTRLPEALAAKADKSSVKTSLDSPVAAGAEYYLGTQTSLAITLPSSALRGDMLYVTYDTGDTAFTPTVTGGTYKGISEIDFGATNATYELCAVYNGTAWVFAAQVITS